MAKKITMGKKVYCDVQRTYVMDYKDAYEGWSWTSLFFAPIPAFWREDTQNGIIGLCIVVAGILTNCWWIGMLYCILMAWQYNDVHKRKLVSQGYAKMAGKISEEVVSQTSKQ